MDIIRLKCDVCGFVEGEHDYSYKIRRWFTANGPVWIAIKKQAGARPLLSARRDYCSLECFKEDTLDRVREIFDQIEAIELAACEAAKKAEESAAAEEIVS